MSCPVAASLFSTDPRWEDLTYITMPPRSSLSVGYKTLFIYGGQDDGRDFSRASDVVSASAGPPSNQRRRVLGSFRRSLHLRIEERI